MQKLLGADFPVKVDNSLGIDHGAWSILVHLYPEADIPVMQLSVNSNLTSQHMYELGSKFSPLHEQGVLIMGSGNVVHNLRMMDRNADTTPKAFTKELDEWVVEHTLVGNTENIFNYHDSLAAYAASDYDHFAPVFYTLGAAQGAAFQVFNQIYDLGSMSMTSFFWL